MTRVERLPLSWQKPLGVGRLRGAMTILRSIFVRFRTHMAQGRVPDGTGRWGDRASLRKHIK